MRLRWQCEGHRQWGASCDTGLAGECSTGALRCFRRPPLPNADSTRRWAATPGTMIAMGQRMRGRPAVVSGCARTVDACIEGVENRCTPLPPTGEDETCDGEDNDCDGSVDEDAPRPEVECGRGACRAIGQSICENGIYVDECQPGAPLERDDCDGVDNDCDGLIDEDFDPRQVNCGQGLVGQ